MAGSSSVTFHHRCLSLHFPGMVTLMFSLFLWGFPTISFTVTTSLGFSNELSLTVPVSQKFSNIFHYPFLGGDHHPDFSGTVNPMYIYIHHCPAFIFSFSTVYIYTVVLLFLYWLWVHLNSDLSIVCTVSEMLAVSQRCLVCHRDAWCVSEMLGVMLAVSEMLGVSQRCLVCLRDAWCVSEMLGVSQRCLVCHRDAWCVLEMLAVCQRCLVCVRDA